MTIDKATILLLAANPLDTPPLALDEEVRAIDASLRTARLRDQIQLVSQWAVRIEDVVELLLHHRPTLLHFSGHGSAQGRIVLATASGGHTELDESAFTEMLRLAGKSVQCIFLNACYSDTQARLIADHIPAAIGASDKIEDEAAAHFARTFYLAFGSGESIRTAFELALAALQATAPKQVQYIHLFGEDAASSIRLAAAAPKQADAGTTISDSTIQGMVQNNYGSVSMTFNAAPEPPSRL